MREENWGVGGAFGYPTGMWWEIAEVGTVNVKLLYEGNSQVLVSRQMFEGYKQRTDLIYRWDKAKNVERKRNGFSKFVRKMENV